MRTADQIARSNMSLQALTLAILAYKADGRMADSARLALEDAIYLHAADEYAHAIGRAADCLAYTLGVFSVTYADVREASKRLIRAEREARDAREGRAA